MPPRLTELQMKTLRCLGVNGPLHIQAIKEKTGMNYATTHRSVKHLEKNNLIWLSDITPRGPKGARTYSLTPYGVLELYLRGDPNDTAKITQHWEHATPRLIANHDIISHQEAVKNMLTTMYPDVVRPMKTREQIEWKDNVVTLNRNTLDMIFLDSIICNQEISSAEIIEAIQRDPDYMKTWEKWFSVKTLLYSHLESLDDRIHGKNGKET
jgi:hypothetical protein